MIIGIFLRNVKTYSGINYIPLSSGEKFCGLVGNNGIGKSSVLEALDVIFNNRQWNYNTSVKKGGLNAKTKPHIVPIYLIEKSIISSNNQSIAIKLSKFIWELVETDVVLAQNKVHYRTFAAQRKILLRDYKKDEYLILPLGISFDNIPNLSIFNVKKLGESFVTDFNGTLMSDENLEIFRPLADELRSLVDYIYIPKDIDAENFAQLQAREIQSLMGESLAEVLSRTVKREQISQINRDLNDFITELSNVLTSYSFRTVTDKQQNIRKNDVYAMIVEAFFKKRKLHKAAGDHWLEISLLSSGEKQKAIIDIANYLLHKYRKRTDNIILAIDEPEASLHMSACYDQFNTLFKMSELCMQLMFTTHWYGFIPTTEKGYVTVITKPGDYHQTDLISIAGYREEIKQTIRASDGKLPFDIRLKSINDFIQSVITSILTDEPYNWLICEGTSERIYFEKYFESIKESSKLRIIPVGGAAEIKRIYNNLSVAYEDFKKEIKGKVVLISDTDSQIVQYDTKSEFKNLLCYRIVNNDKKHDTDLVKVESNVVSPRTEIEDCLNGVVFHQSLLKFVDDYPTLSTITDATGVVEEAAYYSLDISVRKQEILDAFFNTNNNKFRFAQEYVANLTDSHKVPKWITEIKKIFQPE